MTNAVLFSAGQGRRLAPLTNNKPKCMVRIGGRTILEWQLHSLAAAGIEAVTVVTGFQGKAVETALKLATVPMPVRYRHNPFYGVADNIASCWIARDLIGPDTVLINGDTLFDHRILRRLLEQATAPITVTIDRKETYDSDDMKIRATGDRLERIGKTLTGQIDGESIGMLRFLGDGGSRFAARLEARLHDPAALSLWYLSIIDEFAREGAAGVVAIEGLPWSEVDFPHDLPNAAAAVDAFDWPTFDAAPISLAHTAGGAAP